MMCSHSDYKACIHQTPTYKRAEKKTGEGLLYVVALLGVVQAPSLGLPILHCQGIKLRKTLYNP